MNDVILFVFEGSKTEPQIFENLKRCFFNSNPNTVLFATYNTSIYTLYENIKDDEYLDTFYFIKNANAENKNRLNNFTSKQISQIFLFFDYDGHCSNADDKKIKFMLEKFDNETEHGKLFINYPMVESLRDLAVWDINRDLEKCSIKFDEFINYKNIIHLQPNSVNRQITTMLESDWHNVTNVSLQKANWIVNNVNEKPDKQDANNLNQINIFTEQKSKFIANKLVAILNAFPMFLFEYYGYKYFNSNY